MGELGNWEERRRRRGGGERRGDGLVLKMEYECKDIVFIDIYISIYTLLNLLWFPTVFTVLRNSTGIMIIPLTQVIVSGCTCPSIPLIG